MTYRILEDYQYFFLRDEIGRVTEGFEPTIYDDNDGGVSLDINGNPQVDNRGNIIGVGFETIGIGVRTDLRQNIEAILEGLGIASPTAPINQTDPDPDLPPPPSTIIGTSGNDIISGGDGNDIIEDFDPGFDMIDLRGFDAQSEIAQQVGNSVVLDFGNGDSLTLLDLDVNDFLSFDDVDLFV